MKKYSYIVQVIKTDYENEEETIFEHEIEGEFEDEHEACVKALRISYYGCADED